jgi:hypothetical protein
VEWTPTADCLQAERPAYGLGSFYFENGPSR